MKQKSCSDIISSSNEGNSNPFTNKGIEDHLYETTNSKNQALIVQMFPDGHIKYPSVKNSKKNRPRCHTNSKRV